ncbi:hypothetical protein G0U57_016905, partial [Chelydra serpentina]
MTVILEQSLPGKPTSHRLITVALESNHLAKVNLTLLN